MIRVHRAAWVLPMVAGPIRDGWVAMEGGRVAGVGGRPDLPGGIEYGPAESVEGGTTAFAGAILPGLVNAHTHLELSWMRGQVPAGTSMPAWAAVLIALRRETAVDPAASIGDAIHEVRDSGTCLIGDVANTDATVRPLAASGLSALIFREMIGFRTERPDGMVADAEAELSMLPAAPAVRTTLAPHAPYSVSPSLLTALGARGADRPLSIHLAESAAEVEFLQNGGGAWRDVLESVGAWNRSWRPPGCGPVEYLDRLGLLGPRLLAVHGVKLTSDEIARLAAARATVVTCPRSNAWTGAGDPPLDMFYGSGVRVAIGTDSLASVATLSMFDEIAAVRRLARDVPARRILQSATIDGARALGFDDLGSIAPGQRSELIAVRVPPDVDDVEEYLLSGVPAQDVRWLNPLNPVNP